MRKLYVLEIIYVLRQRVFRKMFKWSNNIYILYFSMNINNRVDWAFFIDAI